jgi:hypothetical protein
MNTDELETKGGAEPITNPSEIKSRLDEMDVKLSETIAAAKNAANADQVTAEIKSLKETIGVIKQSVEDLPADYSAQIKAIGDQLDAFQTGAGMATMGKANIPDSFKTITEKIMDSAVYKSMLAVPGAHLRHGRKRHGCAPVYHRRGSRVPDGHHEPHPHGHHRQRGDVHRTT